MARAAVEAATGSEAESRKPVGAKHTIWFSDVVAQKQKAVWDRKWDPKVGGLDWAGVEWAKRFMCVCVWFFEGRI